MKCIITLVAPELDERVINKVFIIIEKSGGTVEDLAWLAHDRAVDIIVNNVDYNTLHEKLAEKLPEIDYVLQEDLPSRKKKLLVCDMDSTIIEQECIDEIAGELGIKDKVAKITELAMNGQLDFADALKERVRLLKGLPEAKLEHVYSNNITVMGGAEKLVSTMKANGAVCILVSGGFTFFTQKITERLGFDYNFANILEIKDGVLTGNVIEPVLDKDSKLATLNQFKLKLGLQDDEIIAVGDGANDLPMLQNAGLGVAYHAKPNVQSQVKVRINNNDLSALVYIQGYKDLV